MIDVRSNEVILTGLSMPHSPRWYRGKLWLLNSGTGDFGYVMRRRALSSRWHSALAICVAWLFTATARWWDCRLSVHTSPQNQNPKGSRPFGFLVNGTTPTLLAPVPEAWGAL